MLEKRFEIKVKEFLKSNGAKVIKYHGDKFSEVGIPDLLVCHKSAFIGIELKNDTGIPKEIQLYQLKEITKASGLAVLLCPTKKGVEHLERYITKNYPNYKINIDFGVKDFNEFKSYFK